MPPLRCGRNCVGLSARCDDGYKLNNTGRDIHFEHGHV